MQLYLMQHGACYSKEVNPEQPLSPLGAEQVDMTAKAVLKMGLRFDVIATSTKRRAMESAKIMAHHLNYPQHNILQTETLKALAKPADSWEFLRRFADEDRVFVAGHLPNLLELTGLLIAGGQSLALQVENGGLMRLDILDPKRPAATLIWYLPHTMLGLVTGVARGPRG